jgi:phage tail sheath protein FI
MGFYLTPGVYAKTIDLSQVVTGVSQSIGAVVGASKRGPVKSRTLVTNVKDFIQVFGEPDPAVSYMHYSALPFLSVARQLYVTRVVGTGALHGGIEVLNSAPGYAAIGSGISPVAPDASPSFSFTVTTGCFLIYAIGPGVYANSEISCKITNLNTSVTPNLFDLEVYQTTGGVKRLVEKFTVSKSKGIDGFGEQAFIEDKINKRSKYIRVLNNSLTTSNPAAMSTDQLLSQGADGSAPASGTYEGAEGWELYQNPDEVDVGILLCGGISVASTQIKMDTIAQSRRDCVAILVVPSGSQDGASELTYRSSTLNLNSSYSALYSPDVKIHDVYTNADLYVPVDGYVGAAFALTEHVRDVWYAPAGQQRGLLNVLGLRINYTQGQQEILYPKQVNFLRTFPGSGTAIWGQKTLQSFDSALSRINVRRLLIVIEKAVTAALHRQVFELNNEFTRLQITQFIDGFMRRIQARNGVYSYQVVCDLTNNTPDVIDANELHVDIYVQPVRAAEFIQLQTVITRTGASFEELIASGGNFAFVLLPLAGLIAKFSELFNLIG